MLAQISEETAKSFIERVPDIIRAAATNPLGLVALIVLSLGILVFFLFRKANAKIKLGALGVVAFCVVVLALVAIRESRHAPSAVLLSCKVSGFVYNGDLTPAVGLQKVRLAYVAANPANSDPVPVATTGPDGSFHFNCSQIKAEAFPIHLRATFSAAGTAKGIESEDQLVFGENLNVNLYVSPRAVSNHYRVSKEILRIPSTELFRRDFIAVTNAAAPAVLSTNKVTVIPRSMRISKDAVMRLRTVQ
jgi:hypothetical protein